MSSPDHASVAGMSYAGSSGRHLAGDRGRQGGDRHRGPYHCHLRPPFRYRTRPSPSPACTVRHPHPLVTGFGMGGDEAGYPPGRSSPRRSGLPMRRPGWRATSMPGNSAGRTASVPRWQLPVTRIGHGVRAIEDPALMAESWPNAAPFWRSARPAISRPGSFQAMPSIHVAQADGGRHHRTTLSSDDPPYFHTSIGREYELAAKHFGL